MKVLLTRALPRELLEQLGDRHEMVVWDRDEPMPRDALLTEVVSAEGLLCMLTDRVDVEMLDRAPVIRVVSQMAVGVDNIDLVECARRGILVGHTPGVLTETVADTAFALLAAIVRRIPEGERTVKSGHWGPWSPFQMLGGDLHGTTLGVVGMGRIGKAVARRASGFDMDVVYSAPREEAVAARHLPLEELLETADHVVLCASLTDRSRGMIGRRQLALLGPHSYLVNVARGPLIDTDALVEALASNRIAGAALDVTDPEPLPREHPLLDLPNCLVVPHLGSASVGTRRAMAQLAVDNLLAGMAGLPMPAAYPPGGEAVDAD